MFPFEKILTYISNEQCALVLGPGIMQFEGKPMNMYLRDKLFGQYEQDVAHYYAQDGLFAFPAQDASVKSDLAQSLRTECYKLSQMPGYDETVLKNIARLPIHLVISINPDTFLSDTFHKYGIRHRFSHFRKGERPSDEVAVPTREEPLIYNLGGSVLEDESLVLDYEDLFSLIGATLGASGLPNGLRTALEKIRTYIFLGFNFEKWHTQVMLRILCGKAAYRKFAGPHQVSDETRTFLTHQFKIEFWDEQAGSFMETLLGQAEVYKDPNPQNLNRPFLRPLLENPLAPEETNILHEIQNAQYGKAIAALLAYAQGKTTYNDVVQLSGRYQYLEQNKTQTDSRDFLTNLNQIADAIIQLARATSASA